ncbi:Hypp8866 [Branchiostoma lanceolatum]|uniref:Hypp8866 protein n=1 Tax=Branchiostoma lanceolatum TaxID=7740 RepID=A0A8J9Z9S8_BRALA|nr:Hypp8866 [Branchiostoma lanceolatum]
MAEDEQQNTATLSGKIKRFEEDVRLTIKTALKDCGWQSLTKEFSVESYTQLDKEGLDLIVECVDEGFPDFRKDVQARVNVAKKMHASGRADVYKGKNQQSFHDKFYRYYLFVRANTNGTYDVFLAYVCRKEEFDFFLSVKKCIAGTVNVMSSLPYMVWSKLAGDSKATKAIVDGVLAAEAATAPKYGGIPNDLGDKLMEFEFVESLIERGTLVPVSDDGSQFKLVIC